MSLREPLPLTASRALLRVALAVCALLFVCAGCGWRTGLDVDPSSSERDASTPRDASGRDASRRDAGIDGGIEPLACDGLPLPRPTEISPIGTLPRSQGLTVFLPDPNGILVLAGESAPGVREVAAFLDLGTRRTETIGAVGALARLPDSSGTATYIAEFDRVIVVGGELDRGDPTDQVLAISGEGDPTGTRRIRTNVLEPFPPGDVQGHVAIYDPRGRRLIVHGGFGRAPMGARRATWTFEAPLAPGGGAVWRELVPATDSPSADVRAMGYDPVSHRAIEITTDEDGAAVHALDLALGEERWTRLGPIDFVPSTRGELVWDDRACGFHLLSARLTRCVLEHWVLVVGADSATPAFRGALDLEDAHFGPSAVFVPSSEQLVVLAGSRCDDATVPSATAHVITLGR